MAQRVRWYLAEPITRKALNALIEAFTRDEYNNVRSWGFSHIAHRGSAIDGQYVERFERILRIEDPFGKVLEFPRVDFDKWIFSIDLKRPSIELRDAPRSPNAFFSQIAQYLDFQLAITPVQVDPLAWVKHIQEDVAALEVRAVWLADLSLTNTVRAKIGLAGGTDVRPFIKTLTGKRSYSVRRIQLTGVHRTQPFKCDLSAEGRVTISVSGTDILSLLRDALASVIEK